MKITKQGLVAIVLLLLSCNSVKPSRDGTPKKGSTAAKNGWVLFAVPPPTEFRYKGDAFSKYIREVVFRITTTESRCKKYQVYEIKDYVGAETFSVPVDAACDYEISVAIGAENTLTPPGDAAISFDSVYRTETKTSIRLQDFGPRKKAPITLRLERTKFGEEVGFETAWLQAIPELDATRPSDSDSDSDKIDPENKGDNPNQEETIITYNADIAPLLKKNCTSCHAPGGSRANSNLTTYQSTMTYKEYTVSKVLDGSMPPSGPLSATEMEVFSKWKRNGYRQ